MALSKADVNNINVTAVASKAIQWNSAADGFEVGTLGGSMVLLTTATASGSANLTFDSSIDSTFDSYVFKFINIHPSASASFTVNFRDGSTAYDATKTTSYFRAYHQENAGGGVLAFDSFELNQSTAFQDLSGDSVITDNDSGISGTLQLFGPSSTTFIKHFMANINSIKAGSPPEMKDSYTAGYCNVTAAIDGVQFKFDSGNIDSGIIKMYGIT